MGSPEVVQPGDKETRLVQFGRSLRDLRVNKELKQKELADKLDISNEYLSRIENGKVLLSVELVKELAEKLRASEFDLLVQSGYLQVRVYHVHYEILKDTWDRGVIRLNPNPKLKE